MMKPWTEHRWKSVSIWMATLILLFVSVVSLLSLQDDSLYVDERRSIEHLGDLVHYNTLAETTTSITVESQQHSPGYFWLLNGWARLTGYSQVGLRFLSVLVGLLALAVLYRMTRGWYGAQTALVITGIFSALALQLYYLHELRMYSMVTLWVLLIMWQYTRMIRPQRAVSRWDYVALYAAVVCLFYTHYFGVFPLVGIGLYHLLFVAKNRRWWGIAAAFIAGGLTFAPWLGVALTGTDEVLNSGLTGVNLLELLRLSVWLFANGSVILMVVAAAGFLLALQGRVLLPLLMGISVLMCLIVANEVLALLPVRRSRYFLLYLPFVAIVVGYGLAKLSRPRITLSIIVVAWFVTGLELHYSPDMAIYTNRDSFDQANYAPYPQALEAFMRADIARTPSDQWVMYSNTSIESGNEAWIGDFYAKRLNLNLVLRSTIAAIDAQLEMDAPVVYIGYDPSKMDADYQATIADSMAGNYSACVPLADGERLYLGVYVHKPASCELFDAPRVEVGYVQEPIALRSYSLHQQGDRLGVMLTWATLGDVPRETYSYSLRIVRLEGDIIKLDGELPLAFDSFGAAANLENRALVTVDTRDWQPGTYELRVLVYNWQTFDVLTPQTTEDPAQMDLILQQFEFPLEDGGAQ